MRYVQLKDLPETKAGTIWEEGNNMAKYPKWFRPLLTCEYKGYTNTQDCLRDHLQYLGKYIMVLNAIRYVEHVYLNDSQQVMFATDKEHIIANMPLLCNFQKGDWFYYKNKPNDIKPFLKYLPNGNITSEKNDNVGVNVNTVEVLHENQIIPHYQSLGWTKGVKFTCNNTEHVVKQLVFLKGGLFVLNKADVCFSIHDCDLIEELYPKRWSSCPKDMGFCETYRIDTFGRKIVYKTSLSWLEDYDYATLHQAKSAFAFAQLSQLHKAMIDKYNKLNNCDWKPDWDDWDKDKYSVIREGHRLVWAYSTVLYKPLAFPTKEMAEFSLKHHKELWEQYYEID